jgi:hypothetical protein
VDRVRECLDDHFVRLMRNWATATVGSSREYSMSTAYDGLIGGDSYDSSMPVIRGEAIDVDVAFQVLEIKERQAVQLYWLYEGRSFRWLAGRLRCSDKTVVERCISGHVVLRAELRRRRNLLGQIAENLKN